MSVAIERGDDPTEARRLRWAVFVEEQGIPVEAEMDGTDPGCTHWLLREDGAPVATLRTKVVDGATLKIGRVATLPEARGRGHARRLMRAALAEARAAGLDRAYLSAQQDVIGWYEALGFAAEGEPYDDAGIPHRDMWADL